MNGDVVIDAEEYFQKMRITAARVSVSGKSTYYAPSVSFAQENIFMAFLTLCKNAGWDVETRQVECRNCNPKKWDIIFVF
jgi:hypothetical protein